MRFGYGGGKWDERNANMVRYAVAAAKDLIELGALMGAAVGLRIARHATARLERLTP